jgi:hypothetical protein
MISNRDLVSGKEYYVKSYDNKYFKGMKFIDYKTKTSLEHDTNYYYINIIMRFRRITHFYSFHEEDYYYDPEKIEENAQKARQQMEQRSLNMILKKVVNEHFEWL